METNAILTIEGVQQLQGEAPETTRLMTEGRLSREEHTIVLSYEETELTGLAGTRTTFRIQPDRVVLTRTGAVESEMAFLPGQEHRSLYNMGFGALMIKIHTDAMVTTMTEHGGMLEVSYHISIEEETAGTITYRIKARRK